MKGRTEVRISGSGGQGIVLAGIVLAEAAILDGFNGLQTQSYGPEARGGASKAEVILCSEPILYPKVQSADWVVLLNQAAAEKMIHPIGETGTILMDEGLKLPPSASSYKTLEVPFTKTAKDSLGKILVTNIVMLGFFTAYTQLVSYENLLKSILSRVPSGTELLNQKALELGRQLALGIER